jgi:uncharacterized cupredoxin-like copper-binding protein
MSIRAVLFIVSCLCIVGLTACKGDRPTPAPLAVTIHAQDIKFDVTTLTAQVDQPIHLTYINEGMIDHGFKIEGLVEETNIKPGQTLMIQFTPTKAGEYRYICAVPGHEPAGMVGTLLVEG